MPNTINLDRKICPGCGTENPKSEEGDYFRCRRCGWCDQGQLMTVWQMMNGGYLDCDRVNLTEFLRTLLGGGVRDELTCTIHQAIRMKPKARSPRLAGISSLLGRYRRAVKSLEKLKALHFCHGTSVTVNCQRYKGPGIAVTDGECWPDHVAVSLQNGNTWRYPLEAVRPNQKLNAKQR